VNQQKGLVGWLMSGTRMEKQGRGCKGMKLLLLRFVVFYEWNRKKLIDHLWSVCMSFVVVLFIII
jgi:hypothetical protein